MSSSTDFVVNIIGNSQSAVSAFNDVGNAAEQQTGKFDKMRSGISVASAAVVAGVVAFGAASVGAYAEAEQSQAALVAAYEKFPGIADVNIEALRALNTEVQKKTGFDDDALAASQATLAQFGLTGDQIQQLTPLMADYAAKTGKDIGTAAEDMGKAIMGQGRALKTVGVDFTDTGDAAGNFDQLMAGLDGTVGGFAETMGDTAAGKAKILEQSFGDIQEVVGEMLIPALTWLVDVGTAVTQWMSENPALVQLLAVVIGALTLALIAFNVAIWASNAALLANPIIWIILAVVALIAAIVLLALNWDTVWKFVTEVAGNFFTWIGAVVDGFVGWWNGIWSAVGQFISDVWNNIVTAVTGYFSNLWLGFQLIGAMIVAWWNGMWSGIASFFSGVWDGILNAIRTVQDVFGQVFGAIGNIVRGAFDGVVSIVRGVINGIIDAVNGVIGGINGVAGAIGAAIGVSISVPRIPRLATGTVTSGPMLALIGDNPGGREVVQPVSTYQDELRRAYTAGQNNNSSNSDRPIYADGVGLIGWIREVAGQEAQLVFAQGESRDRMTNKMGKRRFA